MSLDYDTEETVVEMYSEGFAKDFIYKFLKEGDESVTRKDVREFTSELDKSPALYDMRKQYQEHALAKNRSEKGYIKAREAGERYRKYASEEALDLIKEFYPNRF